MYENHCARKIYYSSWIYLENNETISSNQIIYTFSLTVIPGKYILGCSNIAFYLVRFMQNVNKKLLKSLILKTDPYNTLLF